MLLAVLETVRLVAVMLLPITPALSRRVYLQLGYSDQEASHLQWDDARWGGDLAALLSLHGVRLSCRQSSLINLSSS